MAIKEDLSEIPFPEDWTMRITEDGRKLFLDHSKKTTSWTDPRDRLIKPQNFADCVGQELPYGWEIAYDKDIGEYFIDHNTGVNQLEDPRLQWRCMQESMIHEYLQSAKESIVAKEAILQLKKERSVLANQELAHLKHVLQRLSEKQQQQSQTSLPSLNFGSKNSLTSASSGSLCSKYDPDLLRAEIEVVRHRVSRLKMEENYVRQDLNCRQKGVETLAKINQSLKERPDGYSLSERTVLETRLAELKKAISSIDEEKSHLLKEVVKLRDDVQCVDHKNNSGNFEMPVEKASSASQTDAIETTGNRVAALARARLQYNESKCLLHRLQLQLAALSETLLPAELELDRDQISLINEKEKLLRELKSVCRSDAQSDQQQKLFEKMGELEDDLRQALKLTPQEMVHRSRLHEQKEELEWKIRNTGLSIADLEHQLRSLSASTLSTSSLSTNSSCGSLVSGSSHDLFFSGGAGEWPPSASAARRFEDIRRRAQQLIGSVGGKMTTPLLVNGHTDLQIQSENSVGSGTDAGTRSVSAAVSDESVAGDSGVFEGAIRKTNHENGAGVVTAATPVVAQIMVTLNYDPNVSKLYVVLEKARNLTYLWQSASSNVSVCAVQIRASLLPGAPGGQFNFRTDWSTEIDKPVFKKTFDADINLNMICNNILQLYVWAHCRTNENYSSADCIGEAQLNLAEFNCQMMRSQWINVLSWKLFAIPLSEPICAPPTPSSTGVSLGAVVDGYCCTAGSANSAPPNISGSSSVFQHFFNVSETNCLTNQRPPLLSRPLNTLKEESSDESTVIPSQTSTLTRYKGVFENSAEQNNESATNLEKVSSKDLCLRLTVNDDDDDDDSEDSESDHCEKIAGEEVLLTDETSAEIHTCDRATNTDSCLDSKGATSKRVSKSADNSSRIRRLNRSDSDTSVALHRKEPFKRNVVERRSLRWKRSSAVPSTSKADYVHRCCVNADDETNFRPSTTKNGGRFRTSVDIDLDLQTALLHLERKKEDISALEKLKSMLEQCKSTGVTEVPEFSEYFLHKLSVNAGEQLPNPNSYKDKSNNLTRSDERRARHIIKKAARQVQMLNETKNQHPTASAFRKKMDNLIKSSPSLVNVIRVNDECDKNET